MKFQSSKMGQIFCVKIYLFANPVTFLHARHMCMQITQYIAVIRVDIIERGVCNVINTKQVYVLSRYFLLSLEKE